MLEGFAEGDQVQTCLTCAPVCRLGQAQFPRAGALSLAARVLVFWKLAWVAGHPPWPVGGFQHRRHPGSQPCLVCPGSDLVAQNSLLGCPDVGGGRGESPLSLRIFSEFSVVSASSISVSSEVMGAFDFGAFSGQSGSAVGLLLGVLEPTSVPLHGPGFSPLPSRL